MDDVANKREDTSNKACSCFQPAGLDVWKDTRWLSVRENNRHFAGQVQSKVSVWATEMFCRLTIILLGLKQTLLSNSGGSLGNDRV